MHFCIPILNKKELIHTIKKCPLPNRFISIELTEFTRVATP
nr:MAG TPA: hypothetical protein [Caudoviricetes sp.]